MIYVIFNSSFRYDGPEYSTVVYASTDREDAERTFRRFYAHPAKSDKWHYEYKLVEYPDGFEFYERMRNDPATKPRTIFETTNDNE